MSEHAPVLVVSNRGPLAFSYDPAGELVARRGSGGLVSSLGPLVRDTGATWFAAALSEPDRHAARSGVIEAEGFRFRSLAIDPGDYRMAYDVVSNATLWYLHHGLFDLARRPRLDRRWHEAWNAYRDVNRRFAHAIIDEAPEGALILVQDYHLALVGTWLAQERPDLRAAHFTHIPFCEPAALRMLPTQVAEELLVGMSSHASCGFHAKRWADNFSACCTEVLGFAPATFVSPIVPDKAELARLAGTDECRHEMEWLDQIVGDRQLIVRVDRIELSKNLLRGFWAFDELLTDHPEFRERVNFVALVYPSREGLADYLAYRQEVESLAAFLNERWAVPGWTPIIVDTSDNFPRSLAALVRYDVLLVNPIRDGLNLVAKEGPLLNRRQGVLVLSREAGAWEELGRFALAVNPFDVSGTAEAMATALAMPASQRFVHADRLAQSAAARVPADWLDDQLRAASAADASAPRSRRGSTDQ